MYKQAGRKALPRKGFGSWTARLTVTAEQFRDARVYAGLTRREAAKLLGISLRTVGHWETGKARPTYAGFKLLRVLRHGDFVDPRWSGYSLIRGKLVTPENHSFAPSDMAWLSLTVRRSHAFGELMRDRARLHADAPLGAAAGGRARLAGVDLGLKAGEGDCPRGAVVASSAVPVFVSRGLPSSNRGVSETERDALEAVQHPQRHCAATLPKVGVAAPLAVGVRP